MAYNSFIPANPSPIHRFGCIDEVLFPPPKVLIFSHLAKGRPDLLQGFGVCMPEDFGGFAAPGLQAFQTAMK